MPETPHPTLMNRKVATDDMSAGYSAQLELLTQLTNYGSNLGIRAFSSSSRTLRDLLVCHVLLKQFTRMLDATEILMRAGAAAAARVPVRVAFEAAMFAEWMLVADGERRAACYVVGNLRAARMWTKRAIAGAPEAQSFLKDMGQIGEDIRAGIEALPHGEAQQQLQRLEESLGGKQFGEVNKAFDDYKKVRRGGEPQWYKVAGKNNLRDIAIELQKLPEYIIFYNQGSDVVHSATYSDHIKVLIGGARASPIRDLTGTHNVFNAVGSIAIILFQLEAGVLPHSARKHSRGRALGTAQCHQREANGSLLPLLRPLEMHQNWRAALRTLARLARLHRFRFPIRHIELVGLFLGGPQLPHSMRIRTTTGIRLSMMANMH